LFKDAEKLIKMAQKSLRPQGKLVVIIPNILGANFIAFQKTDNQSNKIIMSREEAVKFFAKCGFEVEHLQGLAYKEHTQNSNFENKLSILKDYYLLLKDFVRKTKGTNQPNYWLFVLVQA
jgi:2-polyprenyl-3-methyl-5-hydroxy-6-metoxy-1,4-benzoquinol methylase